jgi:hypothetical protein
MEHEVLRVPRLEYIFWGAGILVASPVAPDVLLLIGVAVVVVASFAGLLVHTFSFFHSPSDARRPWAF